MRFLPHIGYGTKGYPERVARRLRALNLATCLFAAVIAGFAVWHSFDSTPGLWKAALVNAVAAPIFASVPLFHRFGPRSAALALLLIGYTYGFILIWLLGTGTGMQMYYLAAAGLTFLFFGSERILISALLGVLAVTLVLILEIFVPHDTGILTPTAIFGSFVASCVATFTLLMTTVYYALREAARAEENLAREKEQVQEQSRQLEIANKYKSHFLASASHDLRQPLHALNLFVAQLQGERDPAERRRLIGRTEAAVSSMNELFGSLLDMTRLDAGILEASITEFPLERLFARIKTTFADAARAKVLSLRVVASTSWVKSDAVLLERMLTNLVSNAVRYTREGGVVVGCRRRGEKLRIDVCDTGPGIPEEQRRKIFSEFYQVAAVEADRRGSLGLGLAIVDRLGQLLDHPIELNSRLGHGSRFSLTVPLAAERAAAETSISDGMVTDPVRGKLVLVIDDDPLVLEGMGGVLRSWGCSVVTGDTPETVLEEALGGPPPDLIISDYRLRGATTGIQAIRQLRQVLSVEIPAFLISGDTAPEVLRDAGKKGFHLLHKPVTPMRLRAMLNQVLKSRPSETTRTAAE